MTDVLKVLSLARTALDEPGSLGGKAIYDDRVLGLWNLACSDARLSTRGDVSEWRDEPTCFAIRLIDEAIHMLDVEDHPDLALETCGRLIAEVADGLRAGEKGGDEVEHPAHDLDQALDLIDCVIDKAQEGITA